MKKNLLILGLMLWIISGCGLAVTLSPEEASLFAGYAELTIDKIEPAYGTQIPQRYLSQLRGVIIATATDQNLFRRINASAESDTGESPVPEQTGQPAANPPGKTMLLQIKVTNFKPVPSELEITRSASLGAVGTTCNFMDGDTGQLIDQADFGDVSSRNRGNIVETTELLVNKVGRDIVKYISQRKNLKPDKE